MLNKGSMIFSLEEYTEELEAENERDRLLKIMVEDIVDVWKIIYPNLNYYRHCLDELMELTDQSLKYCWGSEAWVEFDLEKGILLYKHHDGREIERFLVF